MAYSRNPRVDWLLSRSYGQGGAVAIPSFTKNENLKKVEGGFPAGVSDILYHLIEQYSRWNDDGREQVAEWCFLIGGPGNGKSEALRELAGALQIDLEPKKVGYPAPRTVPQNWVANGAPVVPGLEILFINDASIPRANVNTKNSLLLDLKDSIERFTVYQNPIVLFGNINRGILVEEKSALKINGGNYLSIEEKFASQVIEWLASPPELNKESETPLADIVTTLPVDPRNPFYGQFLIPLKQDGTGSHDIIVHAIYLDVLSLLEPNPGNGGPSVDFSTEPPTVSSYQTYGGFSEDGATRENTIAGDLLTKITSKQEWEDGNCIDDKENSLCKAYELCPFAQNAKWLRSVELQRPFLDTLRSIEISAARRLTYRDLLSNFSLSILGEPEEEWLMGSHPCKWVEDRTKSLELGSSGSKQSIVNIVSHRVYTNLFPTPSAMAWQRPTSPSPLAKETLYGSLFDRLNRVSRFSYIQTFERSFSDIDPSKDFESWDGERARVIEAIEALEVLNPSDQVLTLGLFPSDAHSKIERILDNLIREEIINELSSGGKASNAAVKRAQILRKWRYILLSRQVGLASGNLSFKQALRVWLIEQENALRGSSNYLQLGEGIKNLILPANSEQLYIAPIRPRTYCLKSNEIPANTFVVTIPSINLRVWIVAKGDTLIAEVISQDMRKPTELIASMVIDLAVAREALLNSSNASKSFTEIGSSAFARIERARASLISRSRLKQSQVLFLSENGKLHRIIGNPGRAIPLRVQEIKEK